MSFRAALPRYLYDLPGLINSNAEATADSDDKVVEGLQHIVESVLSKFGKHDTIVVVAKADTVPSHFGLLNKRSEVRLRLHVCHECCSATKVVLETLVGCSLLALTTRAAASCRALTS